MNIAIGYAFIAIVIAQAHRFAPIGLAWGNRDFRKYMLERPEKYVLLPAVAIVGCVALVAMWPPGIMGLFWAYASWNAWHFCAQNYGICSLSGGAVWQRRAAFALTAAFTAGTLIVPPTVRWLLVAVMGIELMHWIMDLRLSSLLVRRRQWTFTGLMLVLGLSGLLLHGVTNRPSVCGLKLACETGAGVATLVALDWGLGMWHFLQSRWNWSPIGQNFLMVQ